MDFTEKLRLRGKAEEDLYFAELDRQLIQAMHQQQKLEESEWSSTLVDDPSAEKSHRDN